MRCHHIVCVVLIAVALQNESPQLAQAQQNIKQQKPDLVLLTYDVGDLVLNIRDHVYGSTLHRSTGQRSTGRAAVGAVQESAGGGFFSVPENANMSGNSPSNHMAQIRLAQFGGGGGGGGGGGFVIGSGGGGGGLGGGGMPSQHRPSTRPNQITMDGLIDVIVSTAYPDTWAENGSGPGEIQSLGSALVVWQTQTVHQQVQKLLDQLRDGAGKRQTVTIDARWLLLNSDDLDQLARLDANGNRKVDRQTLERFTRRSSSLRGLTNCFSNQLVYLVSGTRKNVVTSFIPVVGSLEPLNSESHLVSFDSNSRIRFVQDTPANNQSRVGYQPIISNYNFGALLEIRPTVMRDEKTAVVELKSTYTVSAKSDRTVDLTSPLTPKVDRLAVETQELATSMRIPMREPTLVGGLSYVSSAVEQKQSPPGGNSRTEGETPQLYLILELR